MRYLNAFQVAAVGSSDQIKGEFTKAGFKYYTYQLTRRVNPLSDIFNLVRLIKIFRFYRPDIIHTFDTKPSILARLAARLAGVENIIGTITGLGDLYYSNDFSTKITRWVYEKLQTLACYYSDLTIFHNNENAKVFVSKGIVSMNKIMVIPGSGVIAERFDAKKIFAEERLKIKDELGIHPQALVVTMIARIIRTKGVIEFINAKEIVCRQYPRVHFLLVGSPDSESMFKLTSKELSKVKQTGNWIGSSDTISEIFAITDILTLPSYHEGMPRVLLEGAAMGLPIVTTDVSGCNDIVLDGKNGFLVPPEDSKSLAEGIIKLIVNPDLRNLFGEVSRELVANRFEFSIVMKQIADIYKKMLIQKSVH